MGILADRLDRMVVAADAPGGGIRAELSGRTDVTVSFARGYYKTTTEPMLERQLAAVAKLLWAQRTREYQAAVRAAFRYPTVGDRPVRVPRDRAYREARDQLAAEGRSPGGRITVRVQGLRDWRVRIEPGTIRDLDEQEFCSEVRAAAAALIQDQLNKIIILKSRILGAP